MVERTSSIRLDDESKKLAVKHYRNMTDAFKSVVKPHLEKLEAMSNIGNYLHCYLCNKEIDTWQQTYLSPDLSFVSQKEHPCTMHVFFCEECFSRMRKLDVKTLDLGDDKDFFLSLISYLMGEHIGILRAVRDTNLHDAPLKLFELEKLFPDSYKSSKGFILIERMEEKKMKEQFGSVEE